MPLQCSTQWDGLGHIFDHGKAWNGRAAERVVTADGDLVTGIEHMAPHVAGRAVLLDVGRVIGVDGELPDGFAITEEHLTATAEAHGVAVGRGDLVLVRTGQLARARREGWGRLRRRPGARPVVHHGRLAAPHRGRRDRHRHLGLRGPPQRVRARLPAPAPGRHPPHRPPHRRDVGPGALAEDCAADGVHDVWLTAAPLPITGAVGSPVSPVAVK